MVVKKMESARVCASRIQGSLKDLRTEEKQLEGTALCLLPLLMVLFCHLTSFWCGCVLHLCGFGHLCRPTGILLTIGVWVCVWSLHFPHMWFFLSGLCVRTTHFIEYKHVCLLAWSYKSANCISKFVIIIVSWWYHCFYGVRIYLNLTSWTVKPTTRLCASVLLPHHYHITILPFNVFWARDPVRKWVWLQMSERSISITTNYYFHPHYLKTFDAVCNHYILFKHRLGQHHSEH